MQFLPLLGKRLKDDEVMDVLEWADMDVIYQFDRSHENLPDKYWAAAMEHGFQFRFDAEQLLDVIFLYVLPDEGFVALDREESDVPFFFNEAQAEKFGVQEKLKITKGKADFLGVRSDWIRLEFGTHSLHYEFRGGALARATITKTK